MGAPTLARRLAIALSLAGALAASAPADAGSTASRRRAAVDGIWYWQLPDAPSGTRPIQSWSGTGSSPDGTIYVAGMDHVRNSVLYRLPVGTSPGQRPGSVLSYAGDARAASKAAGSWRAGDVAEKFHTRPTWHQGFVWLATLNDSNLSDGYLQKNGFHWYRYAPVKRRLVDRGPGAEHGGLAGITVDHLRRVIYGAMLPTGDIYAYDIAANRTTLLGRPDYGRDYLYAGRALWMGRSGRVYFTAGNDLPGNGTPYDPEIFNHVHYWDPAIGFGEEPGWRLVEQRAIDMVQCFPADGRCYLSDDTGTLYRFDDATEEAAASWTPVLAVPTPTKVWVMQIAPDQSRAYLVARNGELFVYDLAAGQLVRRLRLPGMDPQLDRPNYYGHDAWDLNGRFYFTAFGRIDETYNARLIAIDPARLLAATARTAQAAP